MRNLLMSAFALLFLVACSSDDEAEKGPNYIRMVTESATTITEDSENDIDVNVTLAYTVEQDATVEFELKGNDGDVLALDPALLTFKAGEKVKTLKVRSNKKGLLNEPKVITLQVKSASQENMKQWESGIAITVNPNSDIPVLTEAQKALIDGYRTNLGIDLYRLMGKLDCKVRVVFPIDEVGEEGESVFSKSEVMEFPAVTIFTLSDKATAEQPVLKMVDNAMGLTSVYRSVLEKEISINNQVGTSFPSVAEAVKYDPANETFAMSLDNLVVAEDGSVKFVGNVVDPYNDSISGVPFDYYYSAWERQEEMVKSGATVDVVVKDPSTGEIAYTEPETPMASLVENGLTFRPGFHLISSDISEDAWDTGIWKEPASKLDFAKGQLTFSFPFDHVYSSDWTMIEVTYTLRPATK